MEKAVFALVFALLLASVPVAGNADGWNWIAVSIGESHTAAVRGDGTLWAWGGNANGQLGDGTATRRDIPLRVGTATNWISVSVGDLHTVAIREDGSLWAWGWNGLGQLGLGDRVTRNIPTQIRGGNDWNSVSTGTGHTVAIRSDGTLWAWGANNYGQLGDGTTGRRDAPVQIGSSTDWTFVSAGYNHTVAVRGDGTLWAWGNNQRGQLGLGDTINRGVPTRVGTASDWKSPTVVGGSLQHTVSAGAWHTVAIRRNLTLWAWGDNSLGQLGNGGGGRGEIHLIPIPVQNGTNMASVSAGLWHTLAVGEDGSLWAWGDNRLGQLGYGGGRINVPIPVRVGAEMNWLFVSAGVFHVAATGEDGSLWVWGDNRLGQLGLGAGWRMAFTPVPSGSRLAAAAPSVAAITAATNAYVDLGNERLNAGRLQRAESAFNDALRLSPNHPAATRGLTAVRSARYVSRGDGHLSARRFNEAIAAFDDALRLTPNHPEATRRRAEAIRRRDTAANEHIARGDEHYRGGRFALAIAEFEAARRLVPSHATATTGLERVRRGQTETYVQTRINNGNWHLNREEFDPAISSFQFALQAIPGHAIATQRLELAIARRDTAVKANAHIARGDDFLERKRFNRAIAEFEAALRIVPDHGVANQRLQIAIRERNAAVRARFHSVGLSVGTPFEEPWVIGTAQATLSPFSNWFFRVGCDFGFVSGVEGVGYFSITPFAHFALFLPFGHWGGLYAGVGGGVIALERYSFRDFDLTMERRWLPMVDVITTGLIFGNLIHISYTLRTADLSTDFPFVHFSAPIHKFSFGVIHRFSRPTRTYQEADS